MHYICKGHLLTSFMHVLNVLRAYLLVRNDEILGITLNSLIKGKL